MPYIFDRQPPNGYLRNGNLYPGEKPSEVTTEGGDVEKAVIGEITGKFETVYALYRSDDRRGIPMSVRERYEKVLAEIRRRIREERNAGTGKKLGEILIEAGALDQEALQRGLAEQRQRGKGELLGEVLLALGLIKEEALVSALRMQAKEN